MNALFGILERADPALVDPGVTAQLECLLDEVLVGRQEMMGAIDAVCAQAQRIIGRLTEGAGAGDIAPATALLRSGGGSGPVRPPTPAMRRYVDSLARQNGVTPPAGYAKSGVVCRAFLDQHAPKRDRASAGTVGGRPQPAVAAQGAAGEDRAPDKGMAAPGIPNAVHFTTSARTDEHQRKPQKRARRRTTDRVAEPDTRPRAVGKRTKVAAAPPTQPQVKEAAGPGETSLRIPFGNKEAAQRLGARYRAGGWYAPPGTDLNPFQERGWL